MSELSDYLDLIEPTAKAPLPIFARAPVAAQAPSAVYAPPSVTLAPVSVSPGRVVAATAQADADLVAAARRYCGAAGVSGLGYTPGTVYIPPARPAKYRVSSSTVRSASDAFRYVQPRPVSVAPDPAADRARADCVALCTANPGSPDCAPDAPGRPGSGGFCAAWLPGGTQGAPPGPGGGSGGPGDGSGGPGPGTPLCPEGSFWNGLECQVPATLPPSSPPAQKSNWGLLFGLAAVAFVARRALMR